MKKMSKKVLSFALVIMMMFTMTTGVMAAGEKKESEPKATAITTKPSNIDGTSAVDASGIEGLGNSIVKILTTVGIVASVIVLVVLGIKYMMGSAEEKAEYKKTMLPYLIGAIILFAAVNIASYVVSIAQTIA